MEVAPRYWQSPATLKDIYVSTSGGTASGTESTNAVIGTVTGSTTPGAVTEHPVDQSAGQHQQHDQQRQQHDQRALAAAR